MSRRGTAAVLATLALAGALAGCSRRQLGLPRTEVSAASPDGRCTAWVRNHPSIDPPRQSLWLQREGAAPVRLRSLAEDSDWCDEVVWSADGATVAFLVQGVRLVVVDAPTAAVVSEPVLLEGHGEYPPARVAHGLALSADGRTASFRSCPRGAADHPADASRCAPLQAAPIRDAADPPAG